MKMDFLILNLPTTLLFTPMKQTLSSNSEEQHPSASTDADNLQSTDWSKHKITEGELNDLRSGFEL